MSSENFFPCDIVWHKEIAKTERKEKEKTPTQAGNINWRGKLRAADLLIRLACYVKR